MLSGEPSRTTRARVIFTADDFGRSPTINAAVIRAHREGVLTSASLMVDGKAAGEAVALARKNPGLAVGLHLVLAAGDPALAGACLFASRAARARAIREAERQFRLFAATGLPLSHVDSHTHLHLIPGLFEAVARLAEEYGAGGLRLPRDDLGLSLRLGSGRVTTKLLWGAAFGLLCRRAARALAGARDEAVSPAARPPLVVPDRVHGLMETGGMREEYVLAALAALAGLAAPGRRAGAPPRRLDSPARDTAIVAEFYFHPDTAEPGESLGPNPGDLETLLSPSVRRAIGEAGLVLTSYRELAAAARGY